MTSYCKCPMNSLCDNSLKQIEIYLINNWIIVNEFLKKISSFYSVTKGMGRITMRQSKQTTAGAATSVNETIKADCRSLSTRFKNDTIVSMNGQFLQDPLLNNCGRLLLWKFTCTHRVSVRPYRY